MREQIAYPAVQRASRQHVPPPQEEPEDDDYTTSIPRSAIRYPIGRPYTFTQGNRRIVFHPEPPPKHRTHWMVFVSFGMIAMLALWIGLQLFGTWWSEHQLDATYGFPRTYQVDQVVGHEDSADHPTHFIFLNLKGRVVIIELPGGVVAHARIYNGPAIIGDSPATVPVTADFQDVNGDGKLDMVVHVGNQQFVYINDGTEFKPEQ